MDVSRDIFYCKRELVGESGMNTVINRSQHAQIMSKNAPCQLQLH